jgi:rubrerythrin
MPRVGGFDAAITLRELRPQTRLALRTGDVRAHRDRARERRLPLFDKRDLDSTVDWLRVQADQWAVQAAPRSVTPRTRNFECPSCGYGIARAFPPERCPMCQREAAWTQTARRPFSRRA